MKIYLYTLVALLLILPTSCIDELVDRDSSTAIDQEDLILNGKDAQTALYGVYDGLQDEYATNSYYIMTVDGYSDQIGSSPIATFSDGIEASNINLSTNNIWVSRAWMYNYRTILRANKVIKATEELDENSITDADRKRILGEAKFVRALLYHKLTTLFGDIPLQLDPLASDLSNTNLPRTAQSAVYEQIQKDIKDAVGSLSSLTGGDDQFFASKTAAQALAAKVHLFKGEYKAASDSAKKVIDNTALGLINYGDLWTPSSNKEGLFRVNYTSSDGGSIGFFCSLDGRYEISPTETLYDSFESDDDIRKTFTYVKDENDVITLTLKKYNDPASGTGVDKYYFLRLADIYLVYAEAMCQQNNFTEANIYYNLVRKRAGLGDKTLNSSNWKELILHERGVELFGEGHRWMDLQRAGIEVASEHIVKKFPSQADFDKVKDKFMLWPIPQEEINANSSLSNADQNPGY